MYSMDAFMASALAISWGRKYFPLSNSSPTSFMAGRSVSSRIIFASIPCASAFLVSSTMLSRLPFRTSARSLSAGVRAAVSFTGWFMRMPVSFRAVSPSVSRFSRTASISWIYRISAFSLFKSRSEAKAQLIRSSWEGLAMAMVSPSRMAMVRKAAFTKLLSGRPKEMLDRPQMVASPFSLQ